jgi:hypothetical protein
VAAALPLYREAVVHNYSSYSRFMKIEAENVLNLSP